MEEKYKAMFDQVHASDRLREEVSQMKMRKQTPRRRFPRAALIAAVLLIVLAGSAIASVGMPGTLRGWFAREWEESTGAPMTEEQLALVDDLTQPIGVSDTQNSVTVTVDSITVGNSTMWLLLKISGDYPAEETLRYHFRGIDMALEPDPDQVETPGGYGFDFPYAAVAEDGVLTMLVRFTIDLAGQTSLLDAPRQTVLVLEDLVCNDLEKRGDEDVVLSEGGWTLTFPVEPGEAGEIRSLGEIRVPAMDLESRKIKTIALCDVEISATDITYVRSAEAQEWEPLRCALVLADGTAVEQSSGSSRFRDTACTEWSSVYYWQVPVDLNQVTALRFGDTEIPLSDG